MADSGEASNMTHPPPFLEEPDDTRDAIMKATYIALCKHGYSDLTIQRIGDEFSKSKSLLYHHYDSKDDLLLDFLEFMLDQLEEQVPTYQEGADDHIEEIVDSTFSFGEMHPSTDFAQALVELRTQAAHDEGLPRVFHPERPVRQKTYRPHDPLGYRTGRFSGGGSTGNGSTLPDRVLRNDDPARNQ